MDNFLALLDQVPRPVWPCIAAVIGALTSRFVAIKRTSLLLKREQLRADSQLQVSEANERAAFRTALMTEIGKVREEIKECEAEREVVRTRVNALEEQILVLRAANEIMERWVTFFKQRDGLLPSVLSAEPAP